MAHFCVAEPAVFGNQVLKQLLAVLQAFIDYHPVDVASLDSVRSISRLGDVPPLTETESKMSAGIEDIVALMNRILHLLIQARSTR